MWIPAPSQSKFYARFKHVEIARYVPELDRVIRIQQGPKDDRKPVFIELVEVEDWRKKNNNYGLYTSIHQYEAPDLESARLSNLYFDLDAEDPEDSLRDAKKLVEYLREYVDDLALRVYFTGAKGFHIEVEAVHLGLAPSVGHPDAFRFIADGIGTELGLNTIDTVVYDNRRMWRLPASRHQKTQLHKVDFVPGEFLSMSLSHVRERAEKDWLEGWGELQSYSVKADQWYKEWEGRLEEHRAVLTQERIDRFMKHGTNLLPDKNKELNGIMHFLRTAEDGKRNNALNWAAFKLGQLTQDVHLDLQEVAQKMLEVAMDLGLGEHEARATIKSGINSGRKKPNNRSK